MATLYELKEKYLRLLELAETADAMAFQDALDHLDEAIEEKAENIVMVLREIEGDINILKDEEKRLKERRTALEKKREHLRWYLQSELDSMDKARVKTPRFTISTRNNATKVQIINEEKVPIQFLIPKYSPDKKAIKEALENGQTIEGVELVTERSLQIR